jgi:enamine deaminase RidA (YjgF/YER057c/UK114 family)
VTDIVYVTVFVTSLDDMPQMNEVYKSLMPDRPFEAVFAVRPARSESRAIRCDTIAV